MVDLRRPCASSANSVVCKDFNQRALLQNQSVPCKFASGFIFSFQSCILTGMKILELNHVAIHVADVERSSAFYRDVLRLEMIPRPAFDFPGAWFRLGAAQELHLIGRRVRGRSAGHQQSFRAAGGRHRGVGEASGTIRRGVPSEEAAAGRRVADFFARPGRAFHRIVHI